MCELGAVLEKGASLPKREKDVLDQSVLDPSNAIHKVKIKVKQKNVNHGISTVAFEVNIAMNHVNKCKSADGAKGLAGKFLEELRKWAQPSDLTAT